MAAIAARRCKPIALNMVAEIARDAETPGLPISGIGGITTWRDAAEFMALGAGNVQVCTAAMDLRLQDRRGDDRRACPTGWTRRAIARSTTFVGRAVPQRHRLAVPQPELRHQGAASTRTSASSAAAATSPARTPRTRRSRPAKDGAAPLRGDRRGMRRLQPLRQRLPGRGLHHHGAAAGERADADLGGASEQPAAYHGDGGMSATTNIAVDWRTALGDDHGDGDDRRHAEGRHQPADADRPRPAGARLVPRCVRGGRLHRDGRRHGQHVRAPSGRDNTLPPIAMGSHLDTQPTGGKFDGVLGVLAGLEVLRTLNDHGYRDRRADRGGQLDQRGGHAASRRR